ncbi:hypothetical protein TNCV_2290961 [Trichonephila clavipes]|uniref:Uncharacterized protein n=1 Tax=Trichonephila clavipes TaxID=2585209 RepID=A0A8X6V1Y2_TRICX|nr:hypothetical protein TNCV_2290961 [Trichonephila clavipes]
MFCFLLVLQKQATGSQEFDCLGFNSVTPQFRWRTGISRLSFPSINLTKRLIARCLFRVPPSRKGMGVHLQTSMSSPGFEQKSYGTAEALLTTIPDGNM